MFSVGLMLYVVITADSNILIYEGYDLCDYQTNILCYRMVLSWQTFFMFAQALPTAFAFDYIFVSCVTYIYIGSEQLANAFRQLFLLVHPESEVLMKLRRENLKEIVDQHNMIMK